MSREVEVLVVGAGPAGLALAMDGVRRGLRVRVVERSSLPNRHSRGLILWGAVQRFLEALGVLEELRAEGTEPAGVRYLREGREVFRVDFAEGRSLRHPCPLIVPQSVLEGVLRRRLQAEGVEVEWGWELTSYEQGEAGVRARLGRADGGESEVWCLFLAGCDGMRSAVRALMGCRLEGRARGETYVLCDAELGGVALPRDLFVCTRAKAPLILLPIQDRLWRVMGTRSEPSGSAAPTVEEMREMLGERGPRGVELATCHWLASHRVAPRCADRLHGGRVLLAGDAAHVLGAASSQGLNAALLDALALGWRLEAVLRGGGDPDVAFPSYCWERRQEARRLLQDHKACVAGAAEIFGAGRLRRWFAGATTAKKLLPARWAGFGLPPLPEFSDEHWAEDWQTHGYPPGSRVAEPLLGSGSEGKDFPWLFTGSPNWVVLLFSGRRPNYRDADALQQIAESARLSGMPVRIFRIWCGRHTPGEEWIADSEARAHQQFGADFRSALLLRPDGVCAVRTQPASWQPMAVELGRWYPKRTAPPPCDS